jgi:UDP-N-acetylmuramoyl-L-alanyl-D-glutamate--2,6-diaminopimelate ligase
MMKIKQLIKDLPQISCKGSKELEITGITSHSKQVAPGNLFIAKRGKTFDGHTFIPEIIKAGAHAILTDLYDPSLRGLTQLVTPNIDEVEGELAATFAQHPSEKLLMIGVTGTSGKTTTSYAIRHLLETTGHSTGLIGTIEYIAGDVRYIASRTTPDVVANQKMLREMVRSGCTACVMEVTSHALEQKRVNSIEFDIAVFTNLTHEHLDYHSNMENYFHAKKKLFTSLKNKSQKNFAKTAIFNADSPWAERMQEGCPAKTFTFGIENRADLQAKEISFTSLGSSFIAEHQGKQTQFFWPLAGRFNVYNALAAISVGIVKGLTLEDIAKALASFESAPGRLERVENSANLNIYVDYAHKEDALSNVLKTLRECTKGKIITVFGCGGDRDREKRPKMAKVAEELSDVVIVTSDNPRSEKPEDIAKEIQTGFLHPARHLVELDRKKAIEYAIEKTSPEDILLIAGKGHETKQYFQYEILDFDDRIVAKEYANLKCVKSV